MGFHQFPHYSSFSVPGFNPRNHTAFSQSVSLNSVEIFKERVHLNCVIYKVLHIGEVFGYPLLNSWKRAGGIQETPACVSRLSVASFKFAKHFFFFLQISQSIIPNSPWRRQDKWHFVFSHFTDEKNWNLETVKPMWSHRVLCLEGPCVWFPTLLQPFWKS